MKEELKTNNKINWCPGCPNYLILESVKKTLSNMDLKNTVIATGIGCHGKIFDYVNVNGISCLHGRVLPTATGIKLANPKLNVICFAGDGDTYSEGMEHFIHAGRFNPDITLVVHDNQSFSLTEGQATPTSYKGFKTKAQPLGEINNPLNPIKLALVSGVSFVARCNARDIDHTSEILKQAIKHKGFAFVEIIQDCIVFNKYMNNRDNLMYKVNNFGLKKALELAEEWDYNSKKGKIPIGVFYKVERETLNQKCQKMLKK